MQGETKERWQELCEQAAVEKNPERLLELTAEITRRLEENEMRLKEHHANKQNAA